MRLKIDIEIPIWTKWLIGGIAIGVVLGGGAIVLAQTSLGTFSDNEVLSATKMNGNFSNLQTQINNLVPPGTVVAYASETTPAGWLPCDGRPVNGLDSAYAALYAAIETTYGGSSSTKVFNVPDYRGMFLRGWDNGRGQDLEVGARTAAGAGSGGDHVGSVQADAIQTHAHIVRSVSGTYLQAGAQAGAGTAGYFPGTVNPPVPSDPYQAQEFLGAARGAPETRPKNVYVNYIIKL